MKKNMLGLAIAIAAEAFKNVVDKQGKPYILHCLEVMNGVEDEKDKICAVLHDVPEDTDITINHLRQQGFEEDDLYVIDLLHHRKEEDYLSVYIKKIATSARATRIKLKDLKHNSDISRIKGALTKKHFDKAEIYHMAYQYLSKI